MANNEKKRKTIAKRQAPLKKQFLERLAESGNIQMACRKTGVPRQTYYRWIEMDSEFSRHVSESKQQGRETKCDVAEAGLMSLVTEKDLGAIKFTLQNLHPEYMPPKRYEDHPREKPLHEESAKISDPKTQEERRRALASEYEAKFRDIIVESGRSRVSESQDGNLLERDGDTPLETQIG